ncbi:DinB family protein [Modestobacter sp. VKM Ac-2983]|uniref:DinB family protein n=1 Tax=Modestobacter sp. VKM Ac-2983 TaxID=3004137 RepID=UPI0022AB9D7B|nr:DinB family protein [Modestobacter sp. VKM Ac-2983]MCZ2803607.1 DinB family protein [Modestobacter sp. VKM Ac-2983]
MTVFPPAPTRVVPPFSGGERAAVEAWLEFHRATLLAKCAGLTPGQLGERALPESALSLRGLLRHLTDVERYWFTRVVAGREAPTVYWTDEEDAEFAGVGAEGDDPVSAVPAELAAFTAEVEASRAIAAGQGSLDDLSAGVRYGEQVTLRWVYLHMIEEYARHNGHADLLRERIDGATGD